MRGVQNDVIGETLKSIEITKWGWESINAIHSRRIDWRLLLFQIKVTSSWMRLIPIRENNREPMSPGLSHTLPSNAQSLHNWFLCNLPSNYGADVPMSVSSLQAKHSSVLDLAFFFIPPSWSGSINRHRTISVHVPRFPFPALSVKGR